MVNSSIFERVCLGACALALAFLAPGCLDDPLEDGNFVCSSNEDCSAGFFCGDDGQCTAFVCGTPSDCNSGEGCSNNQCIPAECTLSAVGLEICDERDLDFCHPTTLQCVECLSDADCFDDDEEQTRPLRCDIDRGQCFIVDTSLCGNGQVDRGEDCEPDAPAVPCSDINRDLTGNLSCTRNCRFDASTCESTGVCGNGVLEVYEECDGDNFAGLRCETLGYGPGQLSCDSECSIDFSGCDIGPGDCGDNRWEPGEEGCDDGNESEGDGCDDECEVEEGWDCFPTPFGDTQCERIGPLECVPVTFVLQNEAILPAPIPQTDVPPPPSGITAAIPIEGETVALFFQPDMSIGGAVDSLRVTMSFDHPWVPDIALGVTTPDGYQARINLDEWVFDPAKQTFDHDFYPPMPPPYAGGPVRVDVQDMWNDGAFGDLNSFTLEMCIFEGGGPQP